MTDDPVGTLESPPRRATRAIGLAVRALQVRLRFVAVLALGFAVVGQWDALRNRWDRLTRDLATGSEASRVVSPNVEYFCPMDPGVVSPRPGKCDVCNMALVRRKVGDAAPPPAGALTRMQFSPYRVRLAGLRTAAVEYRPAAREVSMAGIVRDDGLVECRVPERGRSFVVVGGAAEVVADDGGRLPGVKGEVREVVVAPGGSLATAVIRLEGAGLAFPPGTRVFATASVSVAELEPFRSLPSNPPPLVKGDPLAVYVCPRHPERLATERGRCPVDRDDVLQRLALRGDQRVRWWCPMHPEVAADRDGEACAACGGMRLVPRIVSYRPAGEVLTVPESAVVDTGTRAVAFVERMPGMFDGVEIAVGPRCGDVYPVASGLEPGWRVAIRGAFLLDAETRLNPSLAAAYFGASRSARDEPAGGSAAAGEDVCPVSGRPLGSMGTPVTVEVGGLAVRLCCRGCEAKLKASPEKYLPRSGRE